MTASGTQCQVVTMLIAFGISGTLQQFDPNPNGRGVFTCSGEGCTNPVTVPITTSDSNDILRGAGSLSAAQDPQVIAPSSGRTSIHQEGSVGSGAPMMNTESGLLSATESGLAAGYTVS